MILRFTIGASGQPGSRTPITWLQARCRSVGPAAPKCRHLSAKVRPGIEPGPPPYRGGMPPETPADRAQSSRMELSHRLPGVIRASWPLDYGTRRKDAGTGVAPVRRGV